MNTHLSTRQIIAQRGVALVVSMVMLVAITLIGVFVMSGSHLEWLMTNNSNFQTSAYMQAETNLLSKENDISKYCLFPAGVMTCTWPPAIAPAPTQFFNDDPAAGALNPLPTGNASPDQVANWVNHTFNTFVVDYVGIGNDVTTTTTVYTFQVWGYGSDGKGAARIVKSTYMAVANPAPAAFGSCTAYSVDSPSTLCWRRVAFAEVVQ